MDVSIDAGGVRLDAHLAQPSGPRASAVMPGLVLCHGFPAGPRGAEGAAQTYPQFADRIANEIGWVVLAFNFRGTGASEGDFSLFGWLADVRAAIDHLSGVPGVGGVWLAGSHIGGSLAVCAAAEDERVRGVATLAAPADFDDWAGEAKSFLEHARRIGVIRTPGFPPSVVAWTRELRELRPLIAAGKIPPRPLLVVQGSDDPVVPIDHARALADAADAAGGPAELRLVNGGGHRLRHDPRSVAVLLGWLEHQQL